MRLTLNIGYEVQEEDPEAKDILEQIVHEEARRFGATITNRLAAEGVEIEGMQVNG